MMRFYNSDGNVKSEVDDVDFGWTFFNLALEEEETFNTADDDHFASKESFGEDNMENAGKKSPNAEVNATEYSQYNLKMKHKEECCNNDGNVKLEDVDTSNSAMEEEKAFKIEGSDDVASKESFVEEQQEEDDSKMKNGGNVEVNAIDYSRYNLEMRYKEELTDFLLQLDNVESLLLLSIVNNGLYKILEESQKTTELKTSDLDLAMRLNRRERLQKLRNIFGKAPEKNSSLVVDLNQCDLVMDLEECGGEDVCGGEGVCEGSNSWERREAFERIGLNGAIDKTLYNFFDKTCEVHVEVGKIGKCFREIDARVADVKKKTSKFHRDVRETKFLDDVLNLLEGNFEKVVGPVPFRNVGKRARGAGEVNLIV